MSMENEEMNSNTPDGEKLSNSHDFNQVDSTARIAVYDDLLSAPHVTKVEPAPTGEFIEKLSTSIYEQAKEAGGTIPYTVIREVAENFIHAQFKEATVSILDNGNTIRFSDQGPGIPYKDKAQLPGFTSATEAMKPYIRGVGSGLPIVKEYLDYSGGEITIEDNLGSGSVVTISAEAEGDDSDYEGSTHGYESQGMQQNVYGYQNAQTTPQYPQYQAMMPQNGLVSGQSQIGYQQQYGMAPMQQPIQPMQPAMQGQPMMQQMPSHQYGQQAYPQMDQSMQAAQNASVLPILSTLSSKEMETLAAFKHSNVLGVTEIKNLSGISSSTVHASLEKLEQAGLVAKTSNKKRALTGIGSQLISLI